MERDPRAFFAAALPLLLLSALASHAIALAWTDFFSNLWNSIVNAFDGLFHIQTLSAQQQFQNRLGELQANESGLTSFYLANVGRYAKQYNVSVTNVSWSVQVTDVNSTTSPVIGQLTVTWNNTSKSMHVYSGIVNATGFLAFAVNMTHGTFLSLSNDALNENIDGAVYDAGVAEATHGISYRQVG